MELADLGVLGTDIHSHFIPGIDDGAKTLENAVDLIASMAALGYRKVITTPHVMSDYYKNTPKIILDGLEKVREAVKQQGLDIEIEAAAEYYLDETLEAKIDREELLTFGNNYVLFELPFINEPVNMEQTIFALQSTGYKPVMAHVERYVYWHDQWKKYEELYNRGIILQLNIGSLTGAYGPEVKKTAEKLVDAGIIGFLGSDCHHAGHIRMLKKASRMPYLHKVLKQDQLLNASL